MKKALLIDALIFAADLAAQSETGDGQETQINFRITQLKNKREERVK